jgi:hypothetical protein
LLDVKCLLSLNEGITVATPLTPPKKNPMCYLLLTEKETDALQQQEKGLEKANSKCLKLDF